MPKVVKICDNSVSAMQLHYKCSHWIQNADKLLKQFLTSYIYNSAHMLELK